MTAAANLKAETKTVTVAGEEAGGRLDRVLAARIPALSRTRLKALILGGEVTIDGGTIRDPGHHVKSGNSITVTLPAPAPAEPQAENIPLTIIYEDDELIVIDKPKGLVVHPAAGHWTGTLVNALIAHCGDSLSGIGGVKRPGIVHRLDKDTTGLMVVAKTDRAHQSLATQFADHGRQGPLKRGYLAFVWGAPERPKGTIDAPLDRHSAHPRQARGARRRPRSHYPLGGAGALQRPRWQTGGQPFDLPAGNRPHPPDPRPPRPYRSSAARRRPVRTRLQDQSQPSGPGRADRAGGS